MISYTFFVLQNLHVEPPTIWPDLLIMAGIVIGVGVIIYFGYHVFWGQVIRELFGFKRRRK